jgi:hypothetical protein
VKEKSDRERETGGKGWFFGFGFPARKINSEREGVVER